MQFSVPLISLLVMPAVLARPSLVPKREWDVVTNLLIPDEHGVLRFATSDQIANLKKMSNETLSKRDLCSDNNPGTPDIEHCFQYCPRSTSQVLGDPKKVSADVDCTTKPTCPVVHIVSTTITESVTIELGADSPAGEEGNAVLKASAGFSWSKAKATGNSYSFTPEYGQKGYVVFKPWYTETRGVFQVYTHYETDDGTSTTCMLPVVSQDDNASGRNPVLLDGDEADGQYSFCNKDTKEGC